MMDIVRCSVKLWPQKTCNVLSADQDMLIILFASSSNTQFWPKLQASKVESQNILTRLEKGAMVVFIHFYLHFQKLVLLFSVWLSRGHHAVTAVQWQLHVHVSAYFYKIGFLSIHDNIIKSFGGWVSRLHILLYHSHRSMLQAVQEFLPLYHCINLLGTVFWNKIIRGSVYNHYVQTPKQLLKVANYIMYNLKSSQISSRLLEYNK